MLFRSTLSLTTLFRSNAWVRVVGVLRERKLEGEEEPYPYLELQELEVLQKRGKEKVSM